MNTVAAQGWSLSPDEGRLPFSELLRLSMLHRPKPGIARWTQELLADEVGVDARTVRNWCHGKNPPDADYMPKLLKAFGLPPRPSRDEPTAADRIALLLLDARSRRGVEGAPQPSGPFAFPVDLPAEIGERRERIRAAIAAILDAGTQRAGTGALDALAANWPERRLAPPTGAALDEEAEDLFVGLTRAIRTCNLTQPPWSDTHPANDAEERGKRRRRDCYSFAMLLSALIWTTAAWASFPAIAQAQRQDVYRVRDPRLLQCGVEAAQGRAFKLPASERVRADSGRRSADWPPAEDWHVLAQGAIRRGVGVDHHEEILRRLAALFGLQTPTRRQGESAAEFEAALADFELDLAAQIRIRCKEHGGRSFLLAEKFEHPGDPGVAELYRYAQRLCALPLAYDGRGEDAYVRGFERSILVAIDNCLDAISQIP